MLNDYWNRKASSRLSRRRVLVATGAAAASAAFLAACGGESQKEGSSLVSEIVDETGAAKRGGIYKGSSPAEYAHLDPHQAQTPISLMMYSTPWMLRPGHMEPSKGELGGDVVESWELSADKLQITAKINPNAHFAPRSPVDGRSVDARDVVASWQRWSEIGVYRNELVNAVDPNAPVLSLTNTDDRTIVMKLSQPHAGVLGLMTQTRNGNFFIIPREALDSKVIDLRTTDVGSGPWMVKDWKPGQGLFFKRNPGFKQEKIGDVPFMDEVEAPTITEPAVGLAQFRAGGVYEYGIVADEIVRTKKEIPELVMNSAPMTTKSQRFIFGHLPTSPFRDDRVRKAWMMTIDRDAFIDALDGVSKFEAEGLSVETGWDTILRSSAYQGWWLDPKSKDFGPNAKFFQNDLGEAKKLLDAAGYPKGIDTTLHYPPTGYAPFVYKVFEIAMAMVRDSGLFRFDVDLVNYNTEWTPRYRNIRGQIPDVAMITETGSDDPAVYIFSKNHSSGALYQGGDSSLDDIIGKAIREFDDEKRKSYVHEAQRYDGGTMHFPLTHGGSTGFALRWPVVRNQGVWQGASDRPQTFIWLDPTKAPLKRG